jgi:hypothetical protein
VFPNGIVLLGFVRGGNTEEGFVMGCDVEDMFSEGATCAIMQ